MGVIMQQEQSNKSIRELIVDLGSTDGVVRQKSRQVLVYRGETAVNDLTQAFQENNEPVHFEAAKALSQIGSPKAIQIFIGALEDKDFSVRWVAAEGLIAVGAYAIKPLLQILEHRSDMILIREGVHHVIHDLVHRKLVNEKKIEILQEVLDSYQHLEAEIYIPVAAKNALDKL